MLNQNRDQYQHKGYRIAMIPLLGLRQVIAWSGAVAVGMEMELELELVWRWSRYGAGGEAAVGVRVKN